jgi:hypothetical protein
MCEGHNRVALHISVYTSTTEKQTPVHSTLPTEVQHGRMHRGTNKTAANTNTAKNTE